MTLCIVFFVGKILLITLLMMAEFHLAASVSGSQYCACWLTVTAYWDFLGLRVIISVCCEKGSLFGYPLVRSCVLPLTDEKCLIGAYTHITAQVLNNYYNLSYKSFYEFVYYFVKSKQTVCQIHLKNTQIICS